MTTTRTRPDRCPGVFRPWKAEDGNLVRIRLAGGRLPADSLRRLLAVAARYGDGNVHVTGRANLQLRGLGPVTGELVAAIEATGLLPSRSHELVRNLMVSPQTGLSGGRADLRPVVAELDRLLCADPELAALPGRFLFVLDDGRGDLLERPADLGLVAIDDRFAQLRIGAHLGPAVPIVDAPGRLVGLARSFLRVRGPAWHVAELPHRLVDPSPPDPRLPAAVAPLRYGEVAGGFHAAAPYGVVEPELGAVDDVLVVTPWRGLLVPA